MILDCAGLEDEDDDDATELVSAGSGEGGSSSTSSTEVAVGSDDSLFRCVSVLERFAALLLPPRFLVVATAVFEEEVCVVAGRGLLLTGVPGMLSSFRGSGESLRMVKDEGARG